MSDQEVKVLITGDATGGIAAIGQAAQAVRESVSQMRESLSTLTEGFGKVMEGFGVLTAVFAGGEAFKEAIEQTKEWTMEALNLSNALGITTNAASVFAVAMEDVGGSADDFQSASRGLTRQLKTNEKGLNDMGIATRDAHGNLLDFKTIMLNAIETVNSYAAGTDRNIAAQTAFGRGASATSAILRLTKEGLDEAAKSTEELGLVVGQRSKEAFEENRKAMAGAADTMRGLWKVIGDALMPVLTQLAEWFREIGPAAIVVLKVAMIALVTPIWGIITAFNILFDVAQGVFDSLTHIVVGVGKAIYDALHGNLDKAGSDITNIGKGVQDTWHNVWENIVKDSEKARDAMAALFTRDSDAGNAPTGGKHIKPPADKGQDNRLQLYKNALNEMAQARGDFDHKDIAADLQYWEALKANTVGEGDEQVKLRAEIEKEILALKRKAHDEEIKMQSEQIKLTEALALGEIDAKREQLQQELALGKITQAQELQGEIALENQKYAIQKKALDDEIALADKDRLAQQKLKDDELKLEQKHVADVKKIQDKAILEERKAYADLFKSMESGFASTIRGFLNGTTTLAGAIKGLFQDIANSIIEAIANMAAKWLATSLEQILENKTTAVSVIGGLAAQAGAGAFAATAAIPYIGPELAPAAGAAAYAEALSYTAMASAAGGWDIPSNMNPIAQLHQQEMVIPAKYANYIRQATDSGRGGGKGMTVNISAVDARSLQKALVGRGSQSPLANGIRNLHQRFHRL